MRATRVGPHLPAHARAAPGGLPADRAGRKRRRPESNRCTRLCRPLRSHSATAPGASHILGRRCFLHSRSGLWQITVESPDAEVHDGTLHPGSELLRLAWRGDGGAARGGRVRRDPEHGHERRSRAGRDHRARRQGGLPDVRAARRAARHAEHRRRAAPLRLERVLLRALPVGPASARRAPLPARARPALLPHPRDRRQGRSAVARRSSRSSRPRRSRARRATAVRTRSTAGPTGSTSRRSATPAATGRAGSSCSTTTTSR